MWGSMLSMEESGVTRKTARVSGVAEEMRISSTKLGRAPARSVILTLT